MCSHLIEPVLSLLEKTYATIELLIKEKTERIKSGLPSPKAGKRKEAIGQAHLP